MWRGLKLKEFLELTIRVQYYNYQRPAVLIDSSSRRDRGMAKCHRLHWGGKCFLEDWESNGLCANWLYCSNINKNLWLTKANIYFSHIVCWHPKAACFCILLCVFLIPGSRLKTQFCLGHAALIIQREPARKQHWWNSYLRVAYSDISSHLKAKTSHSATLKKVWKIFSITVKVQYKVSGTQHTC